MGVCPNCLFGSKYSDDIILCRVHHTECKLTDSCEWFHRADNKYEAKEVLPEEYERISLEWAQKMQKMYDDTMAVPWEVLLAPQPEWWFDFTKKTCKRLGGFVYKRGGKTPVGKWTIQMYEPIDSDKT